MQQTGADIISAPKITTLSGRQTQIQAVEMKDIVNGTKPQALTPPGVRSTNGVPAQPDAPSQMPVGPTLDVIADVAEDGYTIHLTALPQVTELLRYDNTPDGVLKTRLKVDARNQEARLPLTVIRTQILRSRKMQAAIDVYDGQTLVLANPQVTLTSKQPSGESVTYAVPEDGKRLVVFITATLIDPAGNPIHTPGHEPWSDKTPPQRQ